MPRASTPRPLLREKVPDLKERAKSAPQVLRFEFEQGLIIAATLFCRPVRTFLGGPAFIVCRGIAGGDGRRKEI